MASDERESMQLSGVAQTKAEETWEACPIERRGVLWNVRN